MNGIDIHCVDTEDVALVLGGLFEDERSHEAAFVEVETVDFIACRGNDGVTGGKMIGNCAAEFGDAGAVMEAALGVEVDRTVVLEVDRFRPVIGQYL